MSNKVKIKQVDLSGVQQDNGKTRFLVIDSNGDLSWNDSPGSTGGSINVSEDGTSIVNPATILNFLSSGFSITTGATGEAVIAPYTFPSDLVVSLSGSKSFGKYVSGQTIPASGKTPAEVITMALVENINPTVHLQSSSSVQFNQTSISNVLTFDYTINTLGANVASAVLAWSRTSASGPWTTLSTSTTTPGTYTHTMTDTNFNSATFHYKYTVTDSSGATASAFHSVGVNVYIPPTITLNVAASTSNSAETATSRETGNVSTLLTGTITKNSTYVDLVSYTIQYRVNGGSWIDLPSATNVSIGPGTTTITPVTHNDVSLKTSSSIAYQVKVQDAYGVYLSSYNYSAVKTVNFYGMIFYGPSSTAPITSTAVRALSGKLLTTGANPFNLETGSVERIFTVAMPASLSITQVLDLDALSANITANYVLSTFSVNDFGGTGTSYHVYTMTNAVPYSTGGTPPGNHRHQITR